MMKGLAGYELETYDMWEGHVAHVNDRVAMQNLLIRD